MQVLALRYADMKGSPVPYRRLGCNSLAQVFHDYFRDEMVCNFMHYYNDYVVWMQRTYNGIEAYIYLQTKTNVSTEM